MTCINVLIINISNNKISMSLLLGWVWPANLIIPSFYFVLVATIKRLIVEGNLLPKAIFPGLQPQYTVSFDLNPRVCDGCWFQADSQSQNHIVPWIKQSTTTTITKSYCSLNKAINNNNSINSNIIQNFKILLSFK